MFLMLPAPPGLDSQNPTILYVYGGLKVGVTPAFPGRGRGRWMRSPPSEPGSAGSPAEEHGSERGAFYQKGERNRSSDDLGNEFPGDIGQTHVPAVVIVGKPLMVYP
jgi:hypothetical protein